MLREMGRNSCYAEGEREERGMCISKALATVRLGNTLTAKKANRDISCLSYEPSPMRDWSGTRTPVNQPCYGRFRRRDRKSLAIRLQRFIRLLASLNFQVTYAPQSRIFLV